MGRKRSKAGGAGRSAGGESRRDLDGGPEKGVRGTLKGGVERGAWRHVVETFVMLGRNWRLFVPLVVLMVIVAAMLTGASGEVVAVMGALMFLTIWLTTIWLIRHRLAGREVRLRDGLYNAMAPLISTLMVLVVILVQCLPLVILVVAYVSAVETEFLSTMFYGSVFVIFAGLMVLLSGYLLSSSLMALVAVSVPGMYPLRALSTTAELMKGRRLKFVLRLVVLGVVLVAMWAVAALPVIGLDLWLSRFEWYAGSLLVAGWLLALACVSGIYMAAYLYIYYRWIIGYDDEAVRPVGVVQPAEAGQSAGVGRERKPVRATKTVRTRRNKRRQK